MRTGIVGHVLIKRHREHGQGSIEVVQLDANNFIRVVDQRAQVNVLAMAFFLDELDRAVDEAVNRAIQFP